MSVNRLWHLTFCRGQWDHWQQYSFRFHPTWSNSMISILHTWQPTTTHYNNNNQQHLPIENLPSDRWVLKLEWSGKTRPQSSHLQTSFVSWSFLLEGSCDNCCKAATASNVAWSTGDEVSAGMRIRVLCKVVAGDERNSHAWPIWIEQEKIILCLCFLPALQPWSTMEAKFDKIRSQANSKLENVKLVCSIRPRSLSR